VDAEDRLQLAKDVLGKVCHWRDRKEIIELLFGWCPSLLCVIDFDVK